MFADSLLESSWAQRSRRGWSTLTSFGVQGLAMLVLLLLPILMPVGLPYLKPLSTPVSLSLFHNPPAPQVQHYAHASMPVIADATMHVFTQPSSIPTTISNAPEVDAPDVGFIGRYTDGMRVGDNRGIAGAIGNVGIVVAPPAPAPVVHTVRISHMNPGDLVRRVQPVYPPLARQARVQGQVVLAAIISKEGTIENLRLITGHPMLTAAAIDAVKQWHYRPYILNNEPVEVETEITVNFSLSGN